MSLAAFGCHEVDATYRAGSALDVVLAHEELKLELGVLVAAVSKAGLVPSLKGLKKATIIAPTDEAFNDLGFSPSQLLESAILSNVLLYHVTGQEVDELDAQESRNSLLKDASGIPQVWTVTDTTVTDAIGRKAWIKAFYTTDNGTVLVVNKVLLPQKLTTEFGARRGML